MSNKDILIYFSDQHSGSRCGFRGDELARTPNIDFLAQNGTSFSNAYTCFPLCAPARMAFMAGKYASKLGVLDNDCTLSANYATFAHSLGSIGYDTTLIGRMHFNGYDQRHGFKTRLVGDITPAFPNRKPLIKERKEFVDTLAYKAMDVIGGGTSPVIEFDKDVISSACNYLCSDYENPQLICVGTYAPHHTYVAPKELYEHYKTATEYKEKVVDYDMPYFMGRTALTDHSQIKAAKAAYYGLIEFNDQNVGKVYAKFDEYLKRNNREGVFIYISDHGDEAGERGYFGKMTFFESSVNIPLIFCGAGINKNKKVNTPVSILDIYPTLCELAKSPTVKDIDGESLVPIICSAKKGDDRYVISEIVNDMSFYNKNGENPNCTTYGKMVRYKNWKYIYYVGFENDALLFDLDNDIAECKNVIKDNPAVAKHLYEVAIKGQDAAKVMSDFYYGKDNMSIIKNFAITQNLDSDERWKCPADKMVLPTK